ncbi:MAG: ABC transporter substrate-binding protein [Actinobacteria bacterium]|nr:ABC transporter substrate-binding protein [Actinomycetota bacterium]
MKSDTNGTGAGVPDGPFSRLTRRDVLRAGAAGATAISVGGLLAACGSSSTTTSSGSGAGAANAGKPRRGGSLTAAMVGGTPNDTLEADAAYNFPEPMRNFALYNGLVALDPDGKSISNVLAEEISASKDSMTWTIRLKPEIEFHDGKPLTAKDVLFTLNRIADPKLLLTGITAVAPIDLKAAKVVDPLTLRLPMKTPYATFVEQLCNNYYFGIVPEGYDPNKPIGTGPFKFESFTAGEQSVFARNPNYFKSGLPYLDKLTIIDSFQEPTAALNALKSGTVDVFVNAPPDLNSQVAGDSTLRTLISAPGLWVPFTMRADVKPFDDERVRQAFRLMVNRQQMLASSVGGMGVVANDVYGLHDPCYDSSLTREQDIEQAKALLKQAGQENLTVELVTAPIAAGATESAQVLVQQAKEAGVTVNLRNTNVTTFFTNYLKWTFGQDFLAYDPILNMAAQTSIPGAPFGTTHFDDGEFNKLYEQANRTASTSGRCNLKKEMQKILFDRGAYIIPSFNRTLDIMSTQVNGFYENAGTGMPLGNGDWENAWIA